MTARVILRDHYQPSALLLLLPLLLLFSKAPLR